MENIKQDVKPQVKKGLWKPEEDLILKTYIETHGEGNWTTVSAKSGLMRSGKSCRLRWMNYLRPNIKRGQMSQEEEDLIIRMHKLLGNRWSLIAGRIPGRTDNEVKNYWNTHLNKRKSLPSRKRKTRGTCNNQQEEGNDDEEEKKEGKKRLRRPNVSESQPISSSNITSPMQESESDGRKLFEEKGERYNGGGDETWMMQSAHSMNSYYNIGTPMVSTTTNMNAAAAAAAFVFDEEPFIAYLDSFLLFDSWMGLCW